MPGSAASSVDHRRQLSGQDVQAHLPAQLGAEPHDRLGRFRIPLAWGSVKRLALCAVTPAYSGRVMLSQSGGHLTLELAARFRASRKPCRTTSSVA